AGARIQEIVLAPLRLDDVDRIVVDALHCERDAAHSLAQLVHHTRSIEVVWQRIEESAGLDFFGHRRNGLFPYKLAIREKRKSSLFARI
ncbi:MAG: domain S-box-containing protein, partial [Acidobacteriaceae bacterium]|nr:domain S-box-containing protein [Acidobacteriaceae bacterium]